MSDKKIGGVIITHGNMATELLAAAEKIVGELNHVAAVSIDWEDDVETANEEISKAIKKVSQGKGVLLLTDMFGGTPTNIAAMFLEEGNVEVVTGINLPMIIKIATQQGEAKLTDFAKEIEDQGKQSIYCASELLSPNKFKKNA